MNSWPCFNSLIEFNETIFSISPLFLVTSKERSVPPLKNFIFELFLKIFFKLVKDFGAKYFLFLKDK